MKLKLLIGGLGGLTPLVAALLLADVASVDKYLRSLFDGRIPGEFYLLGYGFKAILLFLVGALWAYLHRSEQSFLRIYQFGVVAPAMIIGSISAKELNSLRETQGSRATPIRTLNAPPNDERQYLSLSSILISSAQAACPSGTCWSKEGGACTTAACNTIPWYRAFWDGFLSRPPAYIFTCGVVPVTLRLSTAHSVTMTEDLIDQSCAFSVDGATDGVTASCRDIKGKVTSPKNSTISITEDKATCTIAVE
jgi:hypothetical protein